MMGWPGQTGHVSRALSQTVITKSNFTFSNSCQDLLRASLASIPKSLRSTVSVYGFTTPDGFAPALYDSYRPWPSFRRKYSAKTLRAEFPVQRNRTRYGWSPCSIGLLFQKHGLVSAVGMRDDLGSGSIARVRRGEPFEKHST